MITRRGTFSRRRISAGATASAGDTTAPSTNAAAHGRPITSWPITATIAIVPATRPTASPVIGRRLARSSRRLAKNAAL